MTDAHNEPNDQETDQLEAPENAPQASPKQSATSESADGSDQLVDAEEERTTLQMLRQIANDMATIPIAFILGTADKPRRFLIDRCTGKSDYQDHHTPPCPIFYVPMPVRWFPDVLEQNSLCEKFGRVGCVRPYDHNMRKVIFGIATGCQIIAFVLTLYAAFAISKKYDILTNTSFTHARGSIVGGKLAPEFEQPMVVDIGLLGVAVGDPDDLSSGFHDQVLDWDDFCYSFTEGFQEFFEIPTCLDCANTSKGLVGSIGMSLLFSIPSFTTDVLRFYPDYDVNCQKFFGSIVSFISMGFSLYTWLSYRGVCVTAFYDNEIGIYVNRTIAEDLEDADVIVDMHWKAGWGYYCIFTATVLKIVDVICNLAVPTPNICRDHAEQAMYEVIALNRDVHDGDASYFTRESVRSLQQSISMAKHRMSSTSLGHEDTNEASSIGRPNPESHRNFRRLSTVEEDSSRFDVVEEPLDLDAEDELLDLDTIQELGASEISTSSRSVPAELSVPDLPTPPDLRLAKSVYF